MLDDTVFWASSAIGGAAFSAVPAWGFQDWHPGDLPRSPAPLAKGFLSHGFPVASPS